MNCMGSFALGHCDPLKRDPSFQRYLKINTSRAQAIRIVASSPVKRTRFICYPVQVCPADCHPVRPGVSLGDAEVQGALSPLSALWFCPPHTGVGTSWLWLLMGRGDFHLEPHHLEGTFIWEVHKSSPTPAAWDFPV